MSKKNNDITLEQLIKGENEQVNKWLTRITLLSIFVFAFFLRVENYWDWQKYKQGFQFKGEYQMSNYDSYRYLSVAKQLKEGSYERLQKLRRVPNGMEDSFVPPLMSVVAASISKFSGVSIDKVAIFIPVFLAPLMCLIVFLLCIKLKFHRVTALTAAFFSIISLTYVSRTRIGVFDTDCLNATLILTNSYLFLCIAELKEWKKILKYFILILLTTFLTLIWWNATSVIILSFVIPLMAVLLFYINFNSDYIKFGVLSIIILITGYLVGEQVITYFTVIYSKTKTEFPNNISVAELDSVDIPFFIKATSENVFIFICMVLGFIALIFSLKRKALILLIPILLAVSPFFIGKRFVLFSAPIFAMSIAYLIQLLYNYNKVIKPIITTIIAISISLLGIASCYNSITDNFQKPAVYENLLILSVLEKYTPKNSNVWTNWDVGYQIQYYLDRGTYADGEFTDGEIYFYVSYPFATKDLSVSANFIRFYSKEGIAGLKDLYKGFSSIKKAFLFLEEIYTRTPDEAKVWLIEIEKNGWLPKTSKIETIDQWITFLYPKEVKDTYLFISHKMTQTTAWFNQGHTDLDTGETIGLPLFLPFKDLKQKGKYVYNKTIKINTETGVAEYARDKRYFSTIASYNGKNIEKKDFSMNEQKIFSDDGRFVFYWDKKSEFGAALSKEMANTTLVKLFLLHEKSPYFVPVITNTPEFQLWKIPGNAYDIQQ